MPDFDLFISYSRADQRTVEPLAQRLRAAGLSVYLDRWYAAPGANWLTALESTLARCRAVAVCAGSELGAWQQREVCAALMRQVDAERRGATFPVIPVLLHANAAPLGFLAQNTWIELTAWTEDELLAILVKAARGEPPGPDLLHAMEQAKAAVCPYRGLLYFREEDARCSTAAKRPLPNCWTPSTATPWWRWWATRAVASRRWCVPGCCRRCARAANRRGRC